MAWSMLSKRKTITASPLARMAKAYIYSTGMSCSSRDPQDRGQAAGPVGHLQGHNLGYRRRVAGAFDHVLRLVGFRSDQPEQSEFSGLSQGQRFEIDTCLGQSAAKPCKATGTVLRNTESWRIFMGNKVEGRGPKGEGR